MTTPSPSDIAGISWQEYVDLLKENTALKLVDHDPYDKWVHFARMLDAYRIFPRLFIMAYIVLLMYSSIWYMALLAPSVAQTGFVSTVIGAGAAWFGLYVNSNSSTLGSK